MTGSMDHGQRADEYSKNFQETPDDSINLDKQEEEQPISERA